MSARTLAPLALTALMAPAGSGCATTRVDPAFYEADQFAVVSVHARRSIPFDLGGGMWAMGDNDLGEEIVEMTLGDSEADLARVLGVTDVVPVGKAMEHKGYDRLPEALPPDEWSQVNRMIAVDVHSPDATVPLSALARALGVDAVVVLRHEWSIARDRIEINDGITAFDRCSLLVVDANGRRLLDDTQVARVPVMMLWGFPNRMGLNGAVAADEIRTLARRAARQCMDQLKEHVARSRPPRAPTAGGAGTSS